MIITLKNADFSKNNINSLLTTWPISKTLRGVTASNSATSVEKGAGYTCTFTIQEGYELKVANVVVKMGDAMQMLTWSSVEAGGQATLSIPSVTAAISISIKATAISGEPDIPDVPVDPNVPTATTWYVKAAHTGLANELNSTNASNGWVYSNIDEQAAIRNKPINALQIATTSTSGTVYVAIADSKGATSVHDLTKGTFTKTGTAKEVVTVLLEKTLTLTDNQYLVFEPSGVAPTRDYVMYFGTPSGSKAGFLSRVPVDTSGTSTAWKDNTTTTIGFSVGYYVEGAPEAPSEIWYVDKASTAYANEAKTDNATFGWAYGSVGEQAAIRNKPINAVKFATTSTSGTVTIGVAKELKTGATITNVQSATFTKNGTAKELVTVVFDNTFTLADDEYLIFEPSSEKTVRDYNSFYNTSGAGFYSRIPQDISGQNKTVALFNYDIGYATGYVPQ
jgi:hypothetical protein